MVRGTHLSEHGSAQCGRVSSGSPRNLWPFWNWCVRCSRSRPPTTWCQLLHCCHTQKVSLETSLKKYKAKSFKLIRVPQICWVYMTEHRSCSGGSRGGNTLLSHLKCFSSFVTHLYMKVQVWMHGYTSGNRWLSALQYVGTSCASVDMVHTWTLVRVHACECVCSCGLRGGDTCALQPNRMTVIIPASAWPSLVQTLSSHVKPALTNLKPLAP